MFEKPQYITPDGYRRLPARPERTPGRKAGAQPVQSASALPKLRRQAALQQKTLSKEAAMLIAMALKAMLREK